MPAAQHTHSSFNHDLTQYFYPPFITLHESLLQFNILLETLTRLPVHKPCPVPATRPPVNHGHLPYPFSPFSLMGNSQSSTSTRRPSESASREQARELVPRPVPNGEAREARPSPKNEDGASISSKTRQRRSLLKLPDFRRNSSCLAAEASTSGSSNNGVWLE